MGQKLQERLKQNKFLSLHQEALLNLLVSADYLRLQFNTICSRYGITGGQYNVLRILNGVYPGAYPRYEIIHRMIEPAPDVTRLIDKLEKLNLVERSYSKLDKRLSLTKITTEGRSLLTSMTDVVNTFNLNLSTKLSDHECKELSEICEKIYEIER